MYKAEPPAVFLQSYSLYSVPDNHGCWNQRRSFHECAARLVFLHNQGHFVNSCLSHSPLGSVVHNLIRMLGLAD